MEKERNSRIHVGLMKKRMLMLSLLLTCFLLFSFSQSREPLLDSLKVAAERLSYHPDSLNLRLEKAAWNMQLEQWEYAKDEYDYVLNREPNNLPALYYRAWANEKLRRYNFARLDYQNLLTLVPAHFEGRLGLALLNQKDKHFTEAMDQINILIQQHPDSALAYAARAGMEKERGFAELAIFDFSEAIKREPDNSDYLLARADLYLADRRYDEARRDLDRLVSMGIPKASLGEFFLRLREK